MADAVNRGGDGAALYPSYVDLDPFLDIERLKGLDAYVRERLEPRLAAARDLAFYTGPFLLEPEAKTLPGSVMVYLTRSERGENYYDLDRTDLWRPTPEAEEFAELTAFLATLPFAAVGRTILIYDPAGRAVTPHRDHDSAGLCHEFIWLRTNLGKPFYMLDPATGERRYVAGHSAWFDTVNQYHGADATGELAWSIRVDGRFTDAFRAQIPFPAARRSSAPALWAKALAAEAAGPNRARSETAATNAMPAGSGILQGQ